MSKVSLFRKWRSQSFSALVGQESTVRTLKNILNEGTPARAYLFCGPRGTGKTSTARIFAKALCCENGPNAEPCDQCGICKQITSGSCFDVMEIDAASNTQVDKIREFIIERVHFAPAQARFKVYIIDEVHKLSNSSFNALLKTLEEPPPHVVFILATTHAHELPTTILSRCQRHEFRPFSIAETSGHLRHIASEESLSLPEDSALYLARAAEGSMRDALVLLEQATNYCGADLSSERIIEMLGILPHQVLEQIVGWLGQQEVGSLLGELQRVHQSGQDLARFCGQLLDYFRQLMLVKVRAHDASLDALPEHVVAGLRKRADELALPVILQWIKVTLETEEQLRRGAPALLVFEMAFIKLCHREAGGDLESLRVQVQSLAEQVKLLHRKPEASPTTTVDAPAKSPPELAAIVSPPLPPVRETLKPPVRETIQPPAPRSAAQPSAPPVVRIEPAPASPNSPEPVASARVARNEKEYRNYLMQRLRENKQMKLYGVLNDAKIEVSDKLVTFSVAPNHTFHFETISQARPLLEQLSQELLGSEVKIVCQIDEKHEKKNDTEQHQAMVRKANSLFAGKILEK
jgi:DNA polymerase-3 subunit gamma/tau